MSNQPSVLFGVKHPNSTSMDGTVRALEWCALRAPDAWGRMPDANIVWFHDVTVRDEFRVLFGGLCVRLDRKVSARHKGKQAANTINRMKGLQA